MAVLVGRKAPSFKANAVINGGEIVNDFSLVVATVNGTGSQTANLALLRALFKMGIPINGKNIFPIQDGRYGLKLYIGGSFKTQFGYTVLDPIRYVVLFKFHPCCSGTKVRISL